MSHANFLIGVKLWHDECRKEGYEGQSVKILGNLPSIET